MKTPYFNYNEIHIACIPKTGSSAIARAIHFALKPDYQIISASGNQEMVDKVMHNPGWQALAPKTFEPSAPIIPVRDPVERFRSACAQEGRTADEAIAKIEAGEASQHFRSQSAYLAARQTNTLYRFPEHIDALAAALGLDDIPEVNTSETNNGPKPDLTPEQLTRVEALYAADITLFNSITEPGTVWTANAELTPGAEPVLVPESVSMHKFRGQLIKEGHLPEVIEAMLSQIPDTIARALALNEWRTAPTVQRAHPMVAQLAAPLGYDTEEKVDAFFIRADTYTFGA